jgi:hypothetical protein
MGQVPSSELIGDHLLKKIPFILLNRKEKLNMWIRFIVVNTVDLL